MVVGVTAGLADWQNTAGFMTHVTCRLTAKNRDQLRNPTLGNRVRATFTFFNLEGGGSGADVRRADVRIPDMNQTHG